MSDDQLDHMGNDIVETLLGLRRGIGLEEAVAQSGAMAV